jgi:hypothetical protein
MQVCVLTAVLGFRGSWVDKLNSCAVFIDLKKAFNTVDIEILLAKLEHYKLPAEWFRSYLTHRKQFT